MKSVCRVMATLVAITTLASCTMMSDERTDCPDGLYVSFVYDYNVDNADIFRTQVGGVTLYVFDASDRLVTTRELTRLPGGEPFTTIYYQDDTRYHLHLPLPAGRYRLVALAQQRPYDELLRRPGAKFRRATLAPAIPADIQLTLDRTPIPSDPTKQAVPNGGVPLDTLWVGHMRQYAIPDTAMTAGTPVVGDTMVEVRDEKPTYAIVSFIRDTNELHVSMHAANTADADSISADDYDVTIVDRNGRIAWDNSVMADDSLLYTPYATRTTGVTGTTTDGVVVATERAAHYDFSLSRLIYSSVPRDNAIMRIVHKPTEHLVAELNLTHLLAEGRTYPLFLRYSPQEFLDRENRYNLELVVLGTGASQQLSYINLSISILNWSKHIQYEILH